CISEDPTEAVAESGHVGRATSGREARSEAQADIIPGPAALLIAQDRPQHLDDLVARGRTLLGRQAREETRREHLEPACHICRQGRWPRAKFKVIDREATTLPPCSVLVVR